MSSGLFVPVKAFLMPSSAAVIKSFSCWSVIVMYRLTDINYISKINRKFIEVNYQYQLKILSSKDWYFNGSRFWKQYFPAAQHISPVLR